MTKKQKERHSWDLVVKMAFNAPPDLKKAIKELRRLLKNLSCYDDILTYGVWVEERRLVTKWESAPLPVSPDEVMQGVIVP